MLASLGSKRGWLVLVAAAIAFVVAPVVEATPIEYNFTVNVTSGPLAGTTENGSFSYDSSSITPGNFNEAADQLTTLDFSFNGITYNASTANTGMLFFDSTGKLVDFRIGNDCAADYCQVVWGSNDWWVTSGVDGFGYSTPASDMFSTGDVTYARAGSVSVPEPDTLSLFGLGALMLGLFVGLRRRAS